MNKPITIVVITYRSKDHILQLLKSIEMPENLLLIDKVIIIENNSIHKYETENIIKKYKKNSKVKIKFILNSDNSGFGKSCNIGAKLSKSKYILFLNPDTSLMSNSLKILYKHAEIANSDLIGGVGIKNDGSHHNTVVRKPNLSVGLLEFTNLGKIFNNKKGHSEFYYEDIRGFYDSKNDQNVDALGGAYLMFKTSAFSELNGFDDNFFMYLEDVDIGVRANRLGFKVVFCPHSKIHHIGGASSENKYRIHHKAWYSSRRYYYAKHHNIFINSLIQPIFIIEEAILSLRDRLLKKTQ